VQVEQEQELAKTIGIVEGVKPRYGVVAEHSEEAAVAVFLVTRCWSWLRWRWSRVEVCLEGSLILVEGEAGMRIC
jgi:hypothetical protein